MGRIRLRCIRVLFLTLANATEMWALTWLRSMKPTSSSSSSLPPRFLFPPLPPPLPRPLPRPLPLELLKFATSDIAGPSSPTGLASILSTLIVPLAAGLVPFVPRPLFLPNVDDGGAGMLWLVAICESTCSRAASQPGVVPLPVAEFTRANISWVAAESCGITWLWATGLGADNDSDVGPFNGEG